MIVLAPFISGLVGALAAAATTLVGRAVLGMGFAMFTYTGVTSFLSLIFSKIKTEMLSMPSEIIAICSMMKVDVVITMILSAYTARMVLNGLSKASDGTVKKWGIK